MQQTGINIEGRQAKVVLRIGETSLSFAVADSETETGVAFEPYTVRSGISTAANLREAFKNAPLLQRGHRRAHVLLDTEFLLVPAEEFNAETAAVFFHQTYTGHEGCVVLHQSLPDLNVVVVFAINKDLKTVIEDRYEEVRFSHSCVPVWLFFHNRDHGANSHRLYSYFHDNKMMVCCFEKGRFSFCNTFKAESSRDAVFYLLYVWKQLGLDGGRDELHLSGAIPSPWIEDTLHRYVHRVCPINLSACFNRAPITRMKQMPFDIITYYMKGK